MNDGAKASISNPSPKAFVTGWPIEHSRSPLIHNHWLQRHGLSGSYEKLATPPDALSNLLQSIRDGHYIGGNVTLPHKENVFALVDKLDDSAKAIGAVNTLWMEGEAIWGGNTDAYGFAANLDQYAPEWRENAQGESALVLGAGGAASAIIHALIETGFRHVIIANRTIERAQAKARKLGASCSAISLDQAGNAAKTARLIVNTTALGMGDDARPPVDFAHCRPDCLVTDIVYSPLRTPMLAAAQDAQLTTVDGLGMLLHQAVPGFQRWFGLRPKVDDALRTTVLADME